MEMENSGQLNSREFKIQGLIDGFLKARSEDYTAPQGAHLDEDSLAAFTEGNLNPREAGPVVSHLVACSFCRHVTAELVLLDLAFAETGASDLVSEAHEPSKVSEVLNGLLSRIFGTSDDAVFALNEEDDNKKEDKDADKDKK